MGLADDKGRSMLRLAITLAILIALNLSSLAAGQPPAPESALKYHSVLVRRPNPGYLFDRFFNAWLEEASVDDLERFLAQQAEEPGRAADGLLLAFFYAKQGEDLKAIKQFRATLADNPGNAAAWYEKGVIEARTLDFETALADLQKASEAEPDDELAVRIAKLRGRLLVRSGRREEALEVFRKLVQQRPGDDQLAEDVIEMQVDEGLLEEATRSARELIANTTDPYRKVLRRLRLGDIRELAGRRSEAVAIYSDVLKDVGAETWLEREVLSQIERAFRKEDDVASLKEQYEKLLEAYPRRVGVRRGYARVLADTGEGEEALEAFREILKITPGDRGNQEAFIALFVRLEDYEGALGQLESLIEQHPGDPELYVQLAQLAAKTEAPQRATEAVDAYLEKSDKGEYAHLRAARLLERLELTGAAREKYAALTEAFPNSPSAKEARASFLYEQGDEQQAIELWEASVAPGDAEQAVRVAKALGARQEHQAAYDVLTEHAPEPADDGLYLAQQVKSAVALEKYDESIPLARRRVDLAAAPAELDDALTQAARAIDRAERTPELIAELEENAATTQRKCLLAELHERTGDIQRADATLAPLLEEGDRLAVTQQVRLARRRNDWETAIAATRRLINLPDGRQSRNVRQLIEFYERAYQIDEALEWVPEWKKLSPGSTSPWLTEARLQQISGDQDLAIETLREAAREFDDASDVRARLASLYTQAGMLADAERMYWRDYEESDEITAKLRAVEQLARVAQQRGKTAKLVESFEERRRDNRESIEPLMALAAIHRVGNNYEKRLQALGEAAKMRPDDVALLKQIARVQEQEGDWKLARDTLQRAAAVDPTNGSKEQLARLHLRWGSPEQGYEMLYELLEDEASDPRSIESIADAMITNGDWRRAAEFLEPHVKNWPEDYRLRYLLAVCHEEDLESAAAAEHFLEVMRAEKDLPGVTPPSVQGRSPYEMLAGVAPPGLQDLVETAQLGYTAYRHRQQNRSYTTSGLSLAMGASPVTMPSSVEDARRYALVHLSQVLPLLEEQRAAACREAALRTGVPVAEIMLTIEQRGNNYRVEPARIAEEFPENDAALAYASLSGGQQMGVEFYRRAFERLADKWPQMAVMAYTHGAMMHEELHELSDRAVELLNRIENPSVLVVMQLCSGPLQAQARGAGSSLPEEYSRAVSERLVAWYPKVRNTPPYGQHLFRYMAMMLAQSEDPKAYVRLLADEVTRSRQDPSGMAATSAYSQPSQNFLTPPTFPPKRLQHFPASVLSVVTTRQGATNPYTGQPQAFKWEDDDLIELLPTVDDPTLRLMLAHSVGATEQVAEAVAALLEKDSPTLDDYLIAASWAVDQERPLEAIELIEKARRLPMKRTLRREVDAYLVALVLDQNDAGENASDDFSDDHLTAGREAALRLRHNVLQPNERILLADALDELGLEEESDRLAQSTSGAASMARPSTAYAVTAQAAQVQPDRIQRLIDNGKQDAAARLLANDVLGIVRQYAGQPHNRTSSNYQFRQLRERLTQYGLEERVLERLDPGDTANHRRVAEYGMVLRALEHAERAVEAFARAVELRPREDSYRVHLIATKAAQGDTSGAAEHFDHFGRNGAGLLAMEIIANFRDNNQPIEERLDLAQLGLDLLKHQRGADGVDLSWADALRQSLGNRQYASGRSLPSLYALDTTDAETNAPGAQRRRKLHDDLCREMMQADQLVEEGFAGLLAAHEAAGEVDEEFVELAREAVDRVTRQPHRVGTPYQNYVVHYSNSPRETPLRSPGEHLVRHAWRTDDWSMIDEEVLPTLRERGRADMAGDVEEYRRLYQCAAEEFSDAARDYVRQRARTANARSSQAGPIDKVCEAFAARELDVDIDALLIDFLRDSSPSGYLTNTPPFVLSRLEQLAVEHDDIDDAVAWLEKLAEVFIGPRQSREELIAREYSQGGYSSNSLNGSMHRFGNLLEQALNRPELLLATSRFIDEGGVSAIVPNAEYRIRSALQSVMNGEVQKGVAFLERAGLLADLEELRLPPADRPPGATSLFEGVVNAFNRGGGSLHKQLGERLAARDPQTCGVLIWRCLIAGDEPSRSRLLEAVGGQLETVRSWDAPRQDALAQQLANVLRSAGANLARLSSAEGAIGEAGEWLNERIGDKNRELAEEILAANRFEELQIDVNNMDQWMANLLSSVAGTDPDTAAKIYLKVTSLYDDAMRRNAVNRYYSRSTTTELFTRMVNRVDDNSPLRTSLLVALVEGEAAEKLGLSHSNIEQVARPLTRKYYEFRNEARQEDGGPEDVVERFHEHVKQTLDGRVSPILIPAYARAFSNYAGNDLEAIEGWLARTHEASDNPLTEHMLAAARTARARRGRVPQQDDGRQKRADRHEFYEAILQDPKEPLAVRVTLADFLHDAERERAPLSTARAIAEVGVAACRSELPLAYQHERAFADNALSLSPDAAAKEYLSAWLERFVDKKPLAQSNRYPRSSHEAYDTGAVLTMLRLCYEFQRGEDAERLVRRYDQRIGSRTETLALLTEAGAIDEAAGLARRNWRQLPSGSPNSELVRYGPNLKERINDLVEKLSDPPVAFVVEAALARIENGEDAEEAGLGTPDSRLTDLAHRFESVPWRSRAERRQALLMLRASQAAMHVAREPLEEAVRDLDLARLAAANAREFDSAAELLAAHAAVRLEQGDPEASLSMTRQLLGGATNNEWRLSNGYRQHANSFYDATIASLDKFDDQELRALADAYRLVLEKAVNYRPSNFYKANLICLAAHARTDQADVYLEWIDGVDQSSAQSAIRSAGGDGKQWSVATSHLTTGEAGSLDERARIVADLVAMSEAAGWINHRRPDDIKLRARSREENFTPFQYVFTEEELPLAVRAVGEKSPAGGVTWAAGAQALEQAGAHRAAADAWRLASENTAEDGQRFLMEYAARRVLSLLATGDYDGAKALLPELEELKRSAPGGQRRYDEVVKKVTEAGDARPSDDQEEEEGAEEAKDTAPTATGAAKQAEAA